jgi:hypothetical protein
MRSIPAFSKEIADLPVVKNDEDGCREGFLEHVDMHKAAERTPRKGLASFQDSDPETKPRGNPAHPEFKDRSDDGLPSFPAPFSKKNIPGGPKKPRTPA